ncbi:MAG: hypothetical protein RLZZ603_1370 [Actinomycetota bacterium]
MLALVRREAGAVVAHGHDQRIRFGHHGDPHRAGLWRRVAQRVADEVLQQQLDARGIESRDDALRHLDVEALFPGEVTGDEVGHQFIHRHVRQVQRRVRRTQAFGLEQRVDDAAHLLHVLPQALHDRRFVLQRQRQLHARQRRAQFMTHAEQQLSLRVEHAFDLARHQVDVVGQFAQLVVAAGPDAMAEVSRADVGRALPDRRDGQEQRTHGQITTEDQQQREADEERRKRDRATAEKKAATLQLQAAKFGAKATKAAAAHQMTRRAERLLSGLEDVREQDRVAKIKFPDPAPCGKTPLMASNLSKSYGSLEIFTAVDLAIDRGSRVVVIGLNGAGKTTLLRMLAGVEKPDTGKIEPGHGLKIGYFAQEHETLDFTKTVLQNMQANASHLNDTDARKVLGSFLFSGDDVDKPAGVLSGGERTRLTLASLVVSSANVLLLDEPTNNLDPASREEILRALEQFKGAIVLVSHDVGAVEALNPERVLILPDGDEDLWSQTYLDLISLS